MAESHGAGDPTQRHIGMEVPIAAPATIPGAEDEFP